jgi:hypothetical protein
MSSDSDDLDWGAVPSAFIDSLNAAPSVPAAAPVPAPSEPARVVTPPPVNVGAHATTSRVPAPPAAAAAQPAAAAAQPAAAATTAADTSFGAQVIDLLDTDADGVVSEAELRAGVSGKLSSALGAPEKAEQTARQVSSASDADSDGVLDAVELTTMAPQALASQRDAETRDSAALQPDEHLAAMLEGGSGAGMYRCLQDAGVSAELEVGGSPTMLRKYARGTTFYASEVRSMADGRERAHAAEGGWVSFVSGSGLQLLEQTGPIGQFVCVARAALVTATLNGTGMGADGVRRLSSGEEVLAVGEAVSSNGARRLRVEDGWVSVVNKKGVVLLKPVRVESPGSRANEDVLLREAQEYVQAAADVPAYTDIDREEAAARIQSRVRGNDARMAYQAKRDALKRGSAAPQISPSRKRETVACTKKLWHELGNEARKAASTLGWTASAWDQGVCPVKYWNRLDEEERCSARFLGFTQRTWDTLGVVEGSATTKSRSADAKGSTKPPSVAACVEALCMLDPSFRQTLSTDSAQLSIETVDLLLENVARGGGALAAESTELLKLLRIALGGGDTEKLLSDSTSAELPVHHRLFQQGTKHTRSKKRADKSESRVAGTPTRSIVARKPVATAKNPGPLPRDNPYASPATSKGYRTLYPDASEIAHHHPLAGAGVSTVVQGLARNHAEMEQPEQPLQSADHEKMLTPWKDVKVKREPLRKGVAQKDKEQEQRRRDALKRRVQAGHRTTVEGPGMFGTAARCRGEVAHTAQVRAKPGHDIEGHARAGKQYIVDETRRENAHELLTGLKKLKGIDKRPWKDEDEMEELSEEERLRRFAERQADQIANVLNQLIRGKRHLYGKIMRDANSAFSAIDADGNGSLDRQEFSQALNRLGLGATDDQVKTLFQAMDRDKDGMVSGDEFVTFLSKAAARKKMESQPARPRSAWLPETNEGDETTVEHEASVCHHLYMQALQSPATVFCDARALVTELLDHGANGLLESGSGETALCKAVAANSWSFARELITRHGASELLLLAAHQRLSWARVLLAPDGIWAKRKKLAARITKQLETIGEQSQVMSVGSAQTLTTLSLMSLPDWVAQSRVAEAGTGANGKAADGSLEASSPGMPRYMRTTANFGRRHEKDPWRGADDQKDSGSRGSSSRNSYAGEILGKRGTATAAGGGGGNPLKLGTPSALVHCNLQTADRSNGSLLACLPVRTNMPLGLHCTARELAIKLHHPLPADSHQRARKLSKGKKQAPAAAAAEGTDPAASPHQRSIEDFWTVHSKVCVCASSRLSLSLSLSLSLFEFPSLSSCARPLRTCAAPSRCEAG